MDIVWTDLLIGYGLGVLSAIVFVWGVLEGLRKNPPNFMR